MKPLLRLDLFVAAGLAGGAILAMGQTSLPPSWLSWSLAVIGLVVLFAWPRGRLVAALLLGLGWANLHAGWSMAERLPFALEGVDLIVEGRVSGLPQRRAEQVRFEFVASGGEGEAAQLAGRTLRLSWYRSDVIPAPGSAWRLALRLERPRGLVNPGGFDSERYALERGIAASGYVRDASENHELHEGDGIDMLRARLSDAMAESIAAPRARFVQALAVGDLRGLTDEDWQVLRATGIAHLIAISGLHVGLVAGFGALLMGLAYRVFPRFGLRLPLPQAAAFAALLAASGYTALAGFALPTVRTLLMIAGALAAVLLRRAFAASQSLALAGIVVLVFDPLAVLNAGFWLSFLGVAWLLWCLPQRMGALRGLLSAQGVMTLALLPLTVWFFGQASLAGPLANLVAVPWVSFVVVPFALLGSLLELAWSGAGAWPFRVSAWLMQGLWELLEPVAGWRGSLVYLPEVSAFAFVLALIGAFWLLLPRGVPGKALALLLFAPLLFPSRDELAQGEAELVLIDVGQGLSALVRTREHAVLVDAGPGFSSGYDAGRSAVLPTLRALGVSQLDVLIVSHGDNDHAGGAAAVKRAYAPSQVLVSREKPEAGERPCEAGSRWNFDGVSFELLHPPEHFPYLRNDSSCVLRVVANGTVALLPGDIQAIIESRLLREQPEKLAADVLLVPHHGSRTSSSMAFVEAVSPKFALIGSGHRNRFGLPREEIVQRYREHGAALADTAQAGAITVRLTTDGASVPLEERGRRQRIWREP